MSNKKRLTALLFVVLLGVGFLAAVFVGYRQVNRRYPEADNEIYAEGEPLVEGHLTYTLIDWALVTMGDIRQRDAQYKTSVAAPRGGLCTDEQIRCLIVTLSVSSDADGQKVIPYRLIPESDGWYNEMDLELFYVFNDNPVTQLDTGETTTLVIPYCLYDFHFRSADWAAIDSREFRLVLTTYPVKRSFALTY
ncbi:MAG: hypothetical protein HFJ79_00100 [Clostridiales bacterium]|jgi:hypothetical protein|nr:hypothetical protein [Clostridiales bacterium]